MGFNGIQLIREPTAALLPQISAFFWFPIRPRKDSCDQGVNLNRPLGLEHSGPGMGACHPPTNLSVKLGILGKAKCEAYLTNH